MSKLTYRPALVFVAGITGLAGCAPAGSQPTPTESPASTSSPLASAPESKAATPQPISTYCSVPVQDGIVQKQIRAGGGVRLNTRLLGKGGTAAVLLHQTDGDGMCGFLFYGEYLAEHGVRVVLMDFCDYGQSDCRDAPPQLPAQVEAVAHAVRDQGAKRIVLVGASLGGSVAVAAAKRTKADAIVDLSGPADFGTLSITGQRTINNDAGAVRLRQHRSLGPRPGTSEPDAHAKQEQDLSQLSRGPRLRAAARSKHR